MPGSFPTVYIHPYPPDPLGGGGGTGTVTAVTGINPIVTTPATIITSGTVGIHDFVASGASHDRGSVPDPGAIAGITKFLREDATWQVPGAAAGGFNWRGEWSNVNYAVNDAVKRQGGVYICQSTITAPDNAPDLYTMRGVWPKRWMAAGTAYEDAVTIESPQFYDSITEQGPSPQVYGNAVVQAINLTVGGDITVTASSPAGTPVMQGWMVLYAQSDQNIGDQLASGFFASGAFPQTMTATGLSAGIYFVIAWCQFPLPFPAAQEFVKLTATTTGTIGAQPTIKWDQINPTSVQVGLQQYRGMAWDEAFNVEHDSTNATITVDWFNHHVVEIQLNNTAVLTNLIFTDPPAYYRENELLRLTITNISGGSIAPGLWTGISGLLGASLLPTSLGPNSNDFIQAYFTFNSRAAQNGSTTPFAVVGGLVNIGGNITNIFGGGNTGFFWALTLGGN
jgi:hypothetical protein